MTSSRRTRWHACALAGLLVAAAACGPARPNTSMAGASDAANRVYVAPGAKDEFYAFMSGGFSGQVSVYGLPSGRLLKVIPVFAQNPENGYGYNVETKALLNSSFGNIPWDDTHHPSLSQTDGAHDGRWLFINANNTPRFARIDLATFETVETIEVPNTGGNHGAPFVTENSEYLIGATRFSVPIPQADVAISDRASKFKGTISFVKANEAGKMDIAFQLLVPGIDYDLGRPGKGPSHGWAFFTSYNTEQAFTKLEVNASKNDYDYIAAVNWKALEACAAGGKARSWPARYAHNVMSHTTHQATTEFKTAVNVIDPKDCAGSIYYLPTPKSPHGVDIDPTGEYIVGGGKLATVIPVHSFSKMMKAIEEKAFEKDVEGIPVLAYAKVMAGEVQNPGLGPLHNEFDDKGCAYTSVFISSEIVKWCFSDFKVVDRVPTYYSIGHLMVPGGDTKKPYGKYVVAMNKITKDRYLGTGPELTQAGQLYDISGAKMKLLLDFPLIGEPHYAQAIDANLLKDKETKFFTLADNAHPWATKREQDAGISRQGKTVHVKMTAIRSHFAPDNIEGVQVGDTVLFHVTNLEQDWDVPHGFAAMGNWSDAELLVMPGQTRTLTWIPKYPGVYPFYCTDFCSALHQEMMGYVRVSPAGRAVALQANVPRPAAAPPAAGKR
ncbi:MAG: Sec-dependent nitrous-oxide reductase [Gemmatimonadaceae bacterium]|nr:Sec-dependent nitrous-oxide reductase [Gemmatimonadaceae bacterium]